MKRALVFAFAVVATASASLAQLPADIDARIDHELPSLVATYKTLHQSPELSMQEAKTSAFLASRLRELGYDVTERVGRYDVPGATCYGVVAVMHNGKGPTALLRTDMDALPVTEQTGLPYASSVHAKNAAGEDVGVMHACGHDIHMTTLLGTAKMLAELKSRWHGTVILVGQPAEEIVAGAKGMLADGFFERFGRPDYAIALHDSPYIAAGKLFYTAGFTMASSDSVDVVIRGIGAHGAAPQNAKDPIVTAAEFVVALQTIVSRETSPLDPVVVTVGSIHGGTKHNIIPDSVKLQLTVRTYKPEVRTRVLESIARIAKGVAIASGIPEELAPTVSLVKGESVDATWNDPVLARRLAAAVGAAIGSGNIVERDPLMVAEDFGRFSDGGRIPSVLMSLGAVDAKKLESGERIPGLHSSGFAPVAEPTIRTGIKAETAMLLELLK